MKDNYQIIDLDPHDFVNSNAHVNSNTPTSC